MLNRSMVTGDVPARLNSVCNAGIVYIEVTTDKAKVAEVQTPPSVSIFANRPLAEPCFSGFVGDGGVIRAGQYWCAACMQEEILKG
jgi:hypothetical protein